MPLLRRHQQHPRLGLSAIARIRIVMGADDNIIHCQIIANPMVHRFEFHRGHQSTGDIRLIGEDDIDKAPCARLQQKFSGIIQNLKLTQVSGRAGLPLSKDNPIDHPIAIKKAGSIHIATTRFSLADR
jgi:hypothetical protein